MTAFSKAYGDTEGPLGIPMKDRQAKNLEQILNTIPQEDRTLRRILTCKAPAELLEGERSDVSWITTEAVDRDGEIVIAKGMDDSQFAANPIVTLNHCYGQPPIARSLWRKRAKDGSMAGIKAKTQYPQRPPDWMEDCWPPDSAFALIKAGLLNGKSIGFIVLVSHCPNSHEIAAKPDLAKVNRIIDEWLLVEYACAFFPTNPTAIVEQVSKANIVLPPHWLPTTPDTLLTSPGDTPPPIPAIPFTTEAEIAAAVRRSLAAVDPQALIKGAVKDAYDRARGVI
jgi:hypothetical protein